MLVVVMVLEDAPTPTPNPNQVGNADGQQPYDYVRAGRRRRQRVHLNRHLRTLPDSAFPADRFSHRRHGAGASMHHGL